MTVARPQPMPEHAMQIRTSHVGGGGIIVSCRCNTWAETAWNLAAADEKYQLHRARA